MVRKMDLGHTASLQGILDDAVSSGIEVGVQIAVYRGKEPVIECQSGLADLVGGVPVSPRTVFPIFSATKGVTSTAVHLQIQRGHLELDAPIARYWPEFAQNGKEDVTVRQALTHQAGIPYMPQGVTVEEMCDWDEMVSSIARLSPIWAPGTRTGYHAYTLGWILGELTVRTDREGRSFGEYVREEICAPLGIEDLWLGVREDQAVSIARLVDGRGTRQLSENHLLAIPDSVGTYPSIFEQEIVRQSCHPAAGGLASAAALARQYASLASAWSGGTGELLNRPTVDHAFTVETEEQDTVLGRTTRKTLGYMAGNKSVLALDDDQAASPIAGYPGAGGSVGWAENDSGCGFAIVKNRMTAIGSDWTARAVAAMRIAAAESLGSLSS